MSNATATVSAPTRQSESLLTTTSSTVDHLQSALASLDNVEGCLFGSTSDRALEVTADGIEARGDQASRLAFELAERLSQIYCRL